ncbi:MAG TPA: MarR family transcriptional regulator [Allosphingosinicella sp.]|jgi:DNA-binding MarR family transcriptional regulator
MDRTSLLQAAASEMQRTAEALAELAGSVAPGGVLPLAMARRLQRQGEIRAEHFPQAMFRAPAWEMLLAIYIAGENGQAMGVGDACAACGVSRSQGARLITHLENEGLIVRQASPDQPQRRRIHITEEGRLRVTSYLLAVM